MLICRDVRISAIEGLRWNRFKLLELQQMSTFHVTPCSVEKDDQFLCTRRFKGVWPHIGLIGSLTCPHTRAFSISLALSLTLQRYPRSLVTLTQWHHYGTFLTSPYPLFIYTALSTQTAPSNHFIKKIHTLALELCHITLLYSLYIQYTASRITVYNKATCVYDGGGGWTVLIIWSSVPNPPCLQQFVAKPINCSICFSWVLHLTSKMIKRIHLELMCYNGQWFWQLWR